MKFRLTRWFRKSEVSADLVIFNKDLKKHTKIKLPRSGSKVVDLADTTMGDDWLRDKKTFVRIESTNEALHR